MRSDSPHRVFHRRQPARDICDRLIAQQAEIGQPQGGFNASVASNGDAATQRMHRIGGLRNRSRAAAYHQQIMAIVGDAAGPCALSEAGVGDEAHHP